MKKNKINKLLLGAAVVMLGGLASCEDYLTVYPTGSITKEDYWNTSNDVHNVRAAAYYQLTQQVGKILTWGEFRSDNVQLIKTENTDYKRLMEARLQPNSNMFDWAGFYKGINFCNEVLENGQRMIDEDIDPSFTTSDWAPIKAEMVSLRALYYFYLVRSFRDVPYVTTCVSTDEEAMNARIGVTPGYEILDNIIKDVEEAQKGAARNYGNSADNKGRWTTFSISALLADMYLWRAALLKDISKKRDAAGNPYPFSGNGDDIVKMSLHKSVENADIVLGEMRKLYDERLRLMNTPDDDKAWKVPFPLTENSLSGSSQGSIDMGYSAVFGSQNGSESVFELQYDGVNVKNTAIGTYFCSVSNGEPMPSIMGANPELFNSISTPAPDKGFGRYDYRFPSTIYKNKPTQTSFPIIKNAASTTYVPDAENVGIESTNRPTMRTVQNANWSVYRLADMMMIKSEAIARLLELGETPSSNAEYAFTTCNALFRRNNPRADSLNTEDATRYVARLGKDNDGNAWAAVQAGKSECHVDLLKLVYNERQREFIGEGKRWFDIVRQCEWENKSNTGSVLSSWMNASKEVESRCRNIWSIYNPIYYDEMKINSADYGDGKGHLVQNPVWKQYMKD